VKIDKAKTALLALVVSFTAHSVFLAASPHIILSGMKNVVAETRRMFRLEAVEEKVADVSLFEEYGTAGPTIKMTQQITPAEADMMKKMILEKIPAEDLSLEKKKERMKEDIFDGIKPEDLEKFDAEESMKAEEEKARKEVEPEKRSLAERLASESFVGYTVPPEGEAGIVPVTAAREGFLGPAAGREAWSPAAGKTFQPGEREMARLPGKAQVGEYKDIGKYLDVTTSVYADPITGEKYFKIVISAKAGDHLGVIPKEMIFLVDSSKSITEEKLSYIKEGLLDAIDKMNPGDRFNLVAFRGDLVKFEERSVPAKARTVGRAKSFIKQFEAVGQTDVENALLKMIEEPMTFRPSYIVLVTDGRPTTGAMDSRAIIQEITRRNNMERPIFCFGGGRRVNRYLLDFISHQNRAWSRFAETTYDIRRDFDDFYSQVSDPVLLNVRYRLVGLSADEVYPKYLSDFYKGRPFTLYGRFENEDVFSFQLLGQMNGETKEFISKGSLRDAEKGNKDIAQEWAFRKIYYLISQNTMGIGDPRRLRREIEELSRKYGIITPYDIEDGD
jgi:uncharacterized protein YegL